MLIWSISCLTLWVFLSLSGSFIGHLGGVSGAGMVFALGWLACLGIFWYFAIYHSVLALAAGLGRWRGRGRGAFPPGSALRCALLYPTRNDFRESSLLSLIECARAGGECSIFILDDSTLPEFQQQIDAWVGRQRDAGVGVRIEVVRREGHGGFKAGNLNHALRRICGGFDCFAVCDADGVFPADFLPLTMAALAVGGPDLAFVQVLQKGRDADGECTGEGEALTWFGRAMSWAVGAHFRHLSAARDRHGFVMFYGHGALIRMSAWEATGGFPEIVTEDLAWSARVRAMGWRGTFCVGTACLEDYPPTYRQLRQRTEKWIRGTAEWLFLKGGGSFLLGKHVAGDAGRRGRHPLPVYVKLDALTHASQHFLALPMLAFLLLTGFVLPGYSDQFRHAGNSFFLWPVAGGKPLVQQAMEMRYHVFWRWDFFLMLTLMLLAPALPALLDLWRQPARLYRALSTSTFLCLACLVAESYAFLAFCFTGRAHFRNTFDAAERRAGPDGKRLPRGVNHPAVFAVELAFGVLFLWGGWTQKNLWLLGPGFALVWSPVVARWGTGNRLVRLGMQLPFLLMVALVLMIGRQVFTLAG